MWELAHHRGLQVGLGDAGGLGGEVGRGADKRGDLAGQRLDPGDAVGLRSEFVVEGDMGEPCGHPLQPIGFHRAQVVFPKELGIRQPRGQHLLVARKDGGTVVGGLTVGDGDEFLNPPGLGVFH
ncbi:hypothetical protein GALL_525380 [mine drainage metagenome]|uniref:Uncharacterized protein n=1 Tax=mine drainage metagenome TaxID=410659 RepID=A0A1J5P2W3_9ZZZZ